MKNVQIRSFSREKLEKDIIPTQGTIEGKICGVVGPVVEALLPHCPIGAIVSIQPDSVSEPLLAEVVGVRDGKIILLPYGELGGVNAGAWVKRHNYHQGLCVGPELLSRVINAFGEPLDGKPLNFGTIAKRVPIDRKAPNPLERGRIQVPLSLGVRAIDSLLTFGQGQRLGIMAGSGVGKSVLMGMMARGSESDVNVIGLIGERGREVREFIENELGEDGLSRSVVVVVTGDQSPLVRVRGAKVVTSIAEYFSSLGHQVLLMVDSLTRVAQAKREIGLAIGETPTSKGYTPSVFSLLPQLLERSGPQPEGQGSISSLYTVLVDSDDLNDPLTDAIRSILDRHIVLSRRLANKGHYPAIDIAASISRVMNQITTESHQEKARRLKALLAEYEENFDFVQMGSYVKGNNQTLDQAIEKMPAIERFLTQSMTLLTTREEAIAQLHQLV